VNSSKKFPASDPPARISFADGLYARADAKSVSNSRMSRWPALQAPLLEESLPVPTMTARMRLRLRILQRIQAMEHGLAFKLAPTWRAWWWRVLGGQSSWAPSAQLYWPAKAMEVPLENLRVNPKGRNTQAHYASVFGTVPCLAGPDRPLRAGAGACVWA